MSLVVQLASLALRPFLGSVTKAVFQGIEIKYTEENVRAIEDFFRGRLTDESKHLQQAIRRAAERAWRSIEIALAGESIWSRLNRFEDRALRAEIRAFLDSNPLQLASEADEAFRQSALEQLRAARSAGALRHDDFSVDTVAKSTSEFLRFTDPVATRDAEWCQVAHIAGHLRDLDYRELADLLELRPVHTQPPLLAISMRFFFRRELEANHQLLRELLYEQVDNLNPAMEAGFISLLEVLEHHGQQLVDLLAITHVIHAGIVDLKAEQAKIGQRMEGRMDRIYDFVTNMLDKLEHLDRRPLRATDGATIRDRARRERATEISSEYRAIPEHDRRTMPKLLNGVGKLAYAAADYAGALKDFQELAAIETDDACKATAHYSAFLAALELDNNPAALDGKVIALKEYVRAVQIDSGRFSLFPPDDYEPLAILGAGGFGVVFLCRNRLSDTLVAIKAIRVDSLDRDAGTVLREAVALEGLQHPAIIRIRHCGTVGAGPARPYLVMDYFEAPTLDAFVKQNGPLSAAETKVLARKVADGLAFAHAKGTLHRDVKPRNLLVRQTDVGLTVKIIDFGLALRREFVRNTLSNADALSNTTSGRSIEGSLDYGSPEQMGRLPGVPESCRSDIYGFGQTLCFALFATPKPGPRHWKELQDEGLVTLIGECIEELPNNRPSSFESILARLALVQETVAGDRLAARSPLADAASAPMRQLTMSDHPPLSEDMRAPLASAEEHFQSIRKPRTEDDLRLQVEAELGPAEK
jgi:serine/threonine protein kinase